MQGNHLIFLAILAIAVGNVEHSNYLTPREQEMRYMKSYEISQIMNSSADPCRQYYKFACGNWKNKYPVSSTTTFTGAFSMSMAEFTGRIHTALQTYNPTDTSSEIKMKNFYKSCVNAGTLSLIDKRNGLKEILAEFGKMPALLGKRWQASKFNWLKTVGEISHRYDIGIFLQYILKKDFDCHSNELILKLQDFSPLTEVEDILVNFLGSKRSYAKRLASDISKFEKNLKALELNSIKSPQKCDNFKSCMSNSPPIDYQQLANLTFGFVPEGEFTILNVDDIAKLATLIKKSPKATVANYIYIKLLLKFLKELQYIGKPEECASRTISLFKKVVSKMSHRVYQLNETVSDYRKVWQDIVTSMEIALEADVLWWYDDIDREIALEKLHMMKLFVDTFDNIDLDEIYEDLHVTPYNYIANVKAIKSFQAKTKRDLLDKVPDHYGDNLEYYSPFYHILLNSVTLPVSALLTNFLTVSDIPKALRYSRGGYIFGHEITHGFEGISRYIDRFGTYVEMNNRTNKEFQTRKICLYKQYKNFKRIKSVRRQDQQQSENISDIVGIALAYNAYLRWLSDPLRTPEELELESLPNLNYTKEQLFFIYYSQTWCAAYRPEYDKETSSHIHTIAPIRAVLPLANFDQFAEAFNCPVGSPMNPKKKCSFF